MQSACCCVPEFLLLLCSRCGIWLTQLSRQLELSHQWGSGCFNSVFLSVVPPSELRGGVTEIPSVIIGVWCDCLDQLTW